MAPARMLFAGLLCVARKLGPVPNNEGSTGRCFKVHVHKRRRCSKHENGQKTKTLDPLLAAHAGKAAAGVPTSRGAADFAL